ncbi:4860_t:CDS:1, partial [Racocetra fulgida]
DSECIECGESVRKPKLDDDHGLVFDKRKIIDRNNASDKYHNEVEVENNDTENKVAD